MTKLRFCLASLCILLFTLTSAAQVQNGQFSGTVTDPSGAAVPNAKITVANEATGLSVSATGKANTFLKPFKAMFRRKTGNTREDGSKEITRPASPTILLANSV